MSALRLREWRLGPGQPAAVLDQFTDEDFAFVVDDRGDVHIRSRDGRFYLGWFPQGRPGGPDEGWKIAVSGTAEEAGYNVSFTVMTPAEVVAAAVTAVLGTSRPLTCA